MVRFRSQRSTNTPATGPITRWGTYAASKVAAEASVEPVSV